MVQIIDPARLEAYHRLLAQPDPADLPHRGHVLRCAGDPNRRATRMPPVLMAWLQERYLEVDVEEPLPVAIRSNRTGGTGYSGLRILRPTGTSHR